MLAGPPRCRERREPAALSHSLAAGVCCFQHLKSNQALSREQMRRQKDRASGAMRETGTCAQSPSQVSTELGAGSGRTSGKLSCQTAVHFLAGTGPISSQAQPGFKRPLHASYLKGGQGARGGRCNLWGSVLRHPPAPPLKQRHLGCTHGRGLEPLISASLTDTHNGLDRNPSPLSVGPKLSGSNAACSQPMGSAGRTERSPALLQGTSVFVRLAK